MKILDNHLDVWNRKPILKLIYQDYYNLIDGYFSHIPGISLEIGSGTGNFKDHNPSIISSDIDYSVWFDLTLDAHYLPFKDNSLSNIVLIDSLHHLSNLVHFLLESIRALKSKGRILILDPYPSAFSKLIYGLFHPEPFIYNVDYFSKSSVEGKNPWSSNQAISYLLFFKYKVTLENVLKGKANIISKTLMSYFVYPLSGGFESKQLIPTFLVRPLLKLEKVLSPLSRTLAFRCFIVIEKV